MYWIMLLRDLIFNVIPSKRENDRCSGYGCMIMIEDDDSKDYFFTELVKICIYVSVL